MNLNLKIITEMMILAIFIVLYWQLTGNQAAYWILLLLYVDLIMILASTDHQFQLKLIIFAVTIIKYQFYCYYSPKSPGWVIVYFKY